MGDHLDTSAVAIIVTGAVNVVTMLIGFLTLWVKLKYGADKADEAAKKAGDVEKKVDDNTEITKVGTDRAAHNAAVAATVAADARAVSEVINQKLNGGIDAAVNSVGDELKKHADRDEKYMAEIDAKFEKLTEYVHQRNHDMLDAMSVQANKLETVLVVLKQEKK